MKNKKKEAAPVAQDSLVPQLEAEELALEEMLKAARSAAEALISKAEKDAEARKASAALALDAEIKALRSSRQEAIRAVIDKKIKDEAEALQKFSTSSQEKKKNAVQFLLRRVLKEQST